MTKPIDPEHELLSAMQAVAIDAYGEDGAPLTFPRDLYRAVFCDGEPVIGDTLVTPPLAERIRDMAERSQTWWTRGPGFPESIPLCQARMLYEYGMDVIPAQVRLRLLAMALEVPEKHRSTLEIAERMIQRLSGDGAFKRDGLELGRDW